MAALVLGDIAVLEVGVLIGVLIRGYLNAWFPIGIGPMTFVGANAAMFILPMGYWIAGLYPGYGKSGVERLRLRVTVTVVLFAALLLFNHLAHQGQWSRGILLTAALFATITIPLWDGVIRALLKRTRRWGMSVAVFGPADARADIIRSLEENQTIGWNCVQQGPWAEASQKPRGGVTLAVMATPDSGLLPFALDEIAYPRVVLVPAFDHVQCLWVTVRDLGTHLGLEMRRNLLVPANRALKRGLDLVGASILLLLSSPLIAVAAVLIAVASPGAPVLYRQRRTGLGGRPFEMLKLRTMVPDADARLEEVLAASPEAAREWRQFMKLQYDPRIIPGIGSFLRRFSIDEMPQFWNILRGDMSLVGPRPLPDYHVSAIHPAVQDLRRKVRPGVTGLCQISGRSMRSLDDQQRIDSYYVRNWSLWLDLHILIRTVVEVFSGKGAW